MQSVNFSGIISTIPLTHTIVNHALGSHTLGKAMAGTTATTPKPRKHKKRRQWNGGRHGNAIAQVHQQLAAIQASIASIEASIAATFAIQASTVATQASIVAMQVGITNSTALNAAQ
jgi:hypothetical protein